MNCHKCCVDIDIDPLDLLFPERMSPEGQEFVRAHGLDDALLIDLRTGAKLMPNGFVKLQHRCQQLDEIGHCRIYEFRPKICREYNCSTRTGDATCDIQPLTFHA